MANENSTKKQRIIAALSSSERARLNRAILGHGKLKATAEATGVHYRTLKNIANTGKGLEENITMIRNELFEPNAA